MSSLALDLVARLPPLRSPQARFLLTVLAGLADDTGEIGPVPLKALAARTQGRVSTVSALLSYLEDELRLIARSEHDRTGPNRFRVELERLRHPDAGRPVGDDAVKVLGGPLDGDRISPPPDAPGTLRRVHSRRLPAYAQRPLVYRPAAEAGSPAPGLPTPRWTPVWLRHEDVDGVGHVYRSGSRTWLHSGLDLAVLERWTRSPLTVPVLRALDVLSVEELRRDLESRDASPAEAARALARGTGYLFEPRPRAAAVVVPEAVAADALFALRRLPEVRTEAHPGGVRTRGTAG
ncbi:hypothetical protein [Saccharothrix sp. HUAS TT1]|uniref:hypothetical protein n=1 Tax=unclassified Saccharothrix TaxID=2593673 RepID=UPI00345B85AD